jgi:hypothetical protein
MTSKRKRILHYAYLHKAFRSFESCCNTAGNAIVIFGHSLSSNDNHILRYIAAGASENLLIGLYGDPATPGAAIKNAKMLADLRLKHRLRNPLNVILYDAESAQLWG